MKAYQFSNDRLWRKAVIRSNVRSWGQSGKHLLLLSFSAFDPDCVKTRMFEVAGAASFVGSRTYARIASIKPPTPRMLITLFML